jgi:hypothetical protein
MSYRDDREALKLRTEHLEQELAEARQEIARLRGESTEGAEEVPLVLGRGSAWLGAPARLTYVRQVQGELPAEAREEVVDYLRRAFGALGRVSELGRGLDWSLVPPSSPRIIEVSLRVRGGKTRLRLDERLGQVAGGLFGGIVGGLGGGGMGFVIPTTLATLGPRGLLFTVPLWLLAVYTAVRFGYRSLVKRRARQLVRVTRGLTALLARKQRDPEAEARPHEPRSTVGSSG